MLDNRKLFIDESAYQAVIIANGEIPSHAIPLQLLKSVRSIICCDGAVSKLLTLGLEPTVIVGDGDSILSEHRQRFEAIFQQDDSKEYNDLTKALHYCLSKSIQSVAIVGASGLREDHALSNLGVMLMFAEQHQMHIDMITNYGVFTPAFRTVTLRSYMGEQISIFSFDTKTEYTFHQLRYPAVQRTFVHFGEGALNEALGDTFTVEFEKGKVLIYRAY